MRASVGVLAATEIRMHQTSLPLWEGIGLAEADYDENVLHNS